MSGLLPAVVETIIAAQLAASFNLTATPLRAGTVAQPGGGWTVDSVTGDPFACRLVPQQQQTPEGLIAAETDSRVRYWLSYPATVTLTAQDRVQIGDVVYEVEAVPDTQAGYAPYNRAQVWRDSE